MNARELASRSSGFTLVEALCALLILGIGLAGLVEAVTLTIYGTKRAEEETIAIALAEGRLDELRAEGYLTEGTTSGDFDAPFSSYEWELTIASSNLDGLYEVAVEVSGQSSKKPLYKLGTLLFDAPYSSSFDTVSEATTSSRSRDRGRESRRLEARRR